MNHLSIDYIKEKWQHAGFQRYFQNTGWMFGSRILSMGVSFLATIFIARNLGPTNYGQLSYAISFISVFGILSTLGIDNILYRDLIRYPDKKKQLLGSAFTIKIVAGLFTAILTSSIAFFFSGADDVSKILILILSGTFVFSSFQIISFEFQAQVRSKYPSIIAFVITIILNILKVLVIVNHRGVIFLALILLLEPILYIVFYWYAYEKKIDQKVSAWRFNKIIALKLLKDSWPLIFTSTFMLIYGRIDQVFIKHMMDAGSVGIYDSAVRIAELWYFIPGIIITSLFPAIINAKKVSEELYYTRLKKLSIALFFLAILISLPVTILAPFIIKILYGSAFIKGVIVLQIYVWACIGTFLGILADNYLVTENYRRILIFRAMIPMIVNVILNILWIPKYGIEGSAYATLISYSLGPISLLFFTTTRKKIVDAFRTKRSNV